MTITIDRAAFSNALDLACSVVERRNTIPALDGVRIVANGAVTFEATNLDNFVRVEALGGGEGSFLLLSPREARAAADLAGGEVVVLERAARKIALNCGALSGSFETLPPEDLPEFSWGAEKFSCAISADDLAQIARVSAAISTEETRYYLNGINVRRLDSGLYRFAATDGHKLMWSDIALAGATGELPQIIIHRSACQITFDRFAAASGPIRFTQNAGTGIGRVIFSAEIGGAQVTLAAKLIDGTYPDYERVIPANNERTIRAPRGELLTAIRAANLLAGGKGECVILKLGDDRLRVSRTDASRGEVAMTIPAESNADSGYEIGFNGRYLLAIIEALRGDDVLFALADPATPALITDPADASFGTVLMPMRVR